MKLAEKNSFLLHCPISFAEKIKKGAVDNVHELYPMLIHRHMNILPQFPILIIIRKKDRGLKYLRHEITHDDARNIREYYSALIFK